MIIIVPMNILGQGYTILGEVKGADGQTVVLKQSRNNQLVDVSTAKVESGKFTMTGDSPYPEITLLYVDTKGPLQFFLENSNISISVDLDNIEKSKVTGSKENDLFTEFLSNFEGFAIQQKQLNDSYLALSMSNVATPDAVMSLRAQLDNLNSDRIAYMLSFVQNNPGRITTAFLVTSGGLMQVMDVSQLEQAAKGFDSSTSESQWVKILTDRVASLKRTDIGQPFPDITLKTPDDKPISISDYAGKGKYVLLDFWAAWCGPCRVANPHIVELYKRYKDKGFEIIGISLDQSKEAWLKAIKDDNLTWPHMSDLGHWQSAAAKLYSVSGIPHMVLLDKEGKIISKGTMPVSELAKKLAEIFD